MAKQAPAHLSARKQKPFTFRAYEGRTLNTLPCHCAAGVFPKICDLSCVLRWPKALFGQVNGWRR